MLLQLFHLNKIKCLICELVFVLMIFVDLYWSANHCSYNGRTWMTYLHQKCKDYAGTRWKKETCCHQDRWKKYIPCWKMLYVGNMEKYRRRPYLISFPMKKKRWPVAELRRQHEHKVPSNEFWPGIRFVKFCVWVVCWFHRMPTMAFVVVVNTVLPSHTVSAIYLQGCKCASSKCSTHNSAWRA